MAVHGTLVLPRFNWPFRIGCFRLRTALGSSAFSAPFHAPATAAPQSGRPALSLKSLHLPALDNIFGTLEISIKVIVILLVLGAVLAVVVVMRTERLQ